MIRTCVYIAYPLSCLAPIASDAVDMLIKALWLGAVKGSPIDSHIVLSFLCMEGYSPHTTNPRHHAHHFSIPCIVW